LDLSLGLFWIFVGKEGKNEMIIIKEKDKD
jgi:hypothetical protein